MSEPVWFWQRIVSPHMAGLAEALARRGRQVTYVAERRMSADRAAQGWEVPELGQAELRIAEDAREITALAERAPQDSIHIGQGLRANGLVGTAQQVLRRRRLRQWAVIETVKDAGWKGVIKRFEYARIIARWEAALEGVLAIGHSTPAWLVRRGLPPHKAYPFAYFLGGGASGAVPAFRHERPFRFLFVGRLIALKRVDLLLNALARLSSEDFELVVVGSGPLDKTLRAMAEALLPGRTSWVGNQPLGAIPSFMQAADCLVLPSRADGWGAVVSEALIAGTPAICSDACGAAGAVQSSRAGGVFRAGDLEGLHRLLHAALSQGRQTPARRSALASWAQCLGAEAGARYLDTILSQAGDASQRPPPWPPDNIHASGAS